MPEPKLPRPSGSTFETHTAPLTAARSRSATTIPATRRGHRRCLAVDAVGPSGGASGGRTIVSTCRPYSIAYQAFPAPGRTVSVTGRKESVYEHPSVRRPRAASRAPETSHAAGRERPEQDRRHHHALRRVDGVRLRLDHLVRALDRAARGEVPLRAADDDRVARGDLPLDVRDDQPEQGGREASGAGGQPVEDRPVRGSPERSADRTVEPDPGVDEGDPLRRDHPARPGWSGSVGVVSEVGPEPPLGLRHALTESAGVILDLVLPDATDVEVARGGMRQVDPGHAGCREHGARLGQIHADLASAHEIEEPAFEDMVRARW